LGNLKYHHQGVKMIKNVKIICSPFSPDIEVIGDMVMKLHVSYSMDEVTIQFNPNFQDYKENDDKPEIKVRQLSVTIPTDETKFVTFDFKKNNTNDIKFDGKSYTVKLMSIHKENLQGQDFFAFEFLVTYI
jgi:hypothetical protein